MTAFVFNGAKNLFLSDNTLDWDNGAVVKTIDLIDYVGAGIVPTLNFRSELIALPGLTVLDTANAVGCNEVNGEAYLDDTTFTSVVTTGAVRWIVCYLQTGSDASRRLIYATNEGLTPPIDRSLGVPIVIHWGGVMFRI